MNSTKESQNLKSIMRYTILLCLVLCARSSCMSQLPGARCAEVQEAGESLAENIKDFDLLLQEVIMSCFEESKLITEASLKFMISTTSTLKVSSSNAASFDQKVSDTWVNLMSSQIEASFRLGYATFFPLMKKAGNMVVGNTVVTEALIQYRAGGTRKKRSTLNSIDDKIKSLRQQMNTSLSGVEQNLHGVAKQLFVMFTESLKKLFNNQQFSTNVDNWRNTMAQYLVDAVHSVIESKLQQFYLILKKSAQQVELIDSIVGTLRNDPAKLAIAVEPAKRLIDEAILDLKKKKIGSTEMIRQLKLKIKWMQREFGVVKQKLQTK